MRPTSKDNVVMLAATLEKWEQLDKPPIFVQEKFDGIRCRGMRDLDGKIGVCSRTGKPIPNEVVRNMAALTAYYIQLHCGRYADGELIIPGAPFHYVSEVCRSRTHVDSHLVKWVLFDLIDRNWPFERRYEMLRCALNQLCPVDNIKLAPILERFDTIDSKHIQQWSEEYLATNSVEGLIFRCGYKPYLVKRCTIRDAALIKYTQYQTSTAVILDMVEQRSSLDTTSYRRTDNTLPTNMMGTLVVRDNEGRFAEPFEIGTGFNQAMRRNFWLRRPEFLGKIVAYKYKPFGVKTKPRSPTYLGIREAGY